MTEIVLLPFWLKQRLIAWWPMSIIRNDKCYFTTKNVFQEKGCRIISIATSCSTISSLCQINFSSSDTSMTIFSVWTIFCLLFLLKTYNFQSSKCSNLKFFNLYLKRIQCCIFRLIFLKQKFMKINKWQIKKNNQ